MFKYWRWFRKNVLKNHKDPRWIRKLAWRPFTQIGYDDRLSGRIIFGFFDFFEQTTDESLVRSHGTKCARRPLGRDGDIIYL